MSSIFETLEQMRKVKMISEKVDIKKVIKDLIDAKPSDDNEEQGKIVQLLRGLAFSDDKLATEFMKKLTDLMSMENFGGVLKVSESITDKIMDGDYNGKMKKLKANLPKVFSGIVKGGLSDRFFDGLNSVKEMKFSDSTIVYFLETPGHGWFFDVTGKFVGEEDDGLEGKYKKYNSEMTKEFFKKSVKGII